MAVRSAGIVLFRHRLGAPEVFLVHPGGPFWAKKDDGAWSIPKGVCGPEEAAEAAARREFAEETGSVINVPLIPLGDFRQPGGKIVTAFAARGDIDPAAVTSSTVTIEWPPRSGVTAEFPEIDRAGWFDRDVAVQKILKGQRPILDALYGRRGA